MSSVEKVSNVLGDRKEKVVTTPLLEKKSLTKDFDKGTDEIAYTPLLEKKSSTKYHIFLDRFFFKRYNRRCTA